MNRKRRKLLLLFILLLLLVGLPVWWLNREIQHERDNAILIEAIGHNDTVAVKTLLDRGADPNTRFKPGEKIPLWRLVLDKIRGKHTKEDNSSMPALYIACISEWQNPEIIQSLIRHGADMNGRIYEGDTPLVTCVSVRHSIAAMALLNSGADVNGSGSGSSTPLMTSAYNGDLPIVQELLNKGADLTTRQFFNLMDRQRTHNAVPRP